MMDYAPLELVLKRPYARGGGGLGLSRFLRALARPRGRLISVLDIRRPRHRCAQGMMNGECVVDEKRERKNISLHIIITIESSQWSLGKERSSKRESIERERENAERIIEFL